MAEINFGRARAVYLCEFEGGTRSLLECRSNEKRDDKKKKKVFSTNISTNSGCRLKIPAIFDEFLSKVQIKKKKTSLSQKFYDIQCESTKVTKKQFLLANSRAVNNNLGVLGLDLHSSSPEPINFFGVQFSFGGTQAVIWGARPRNAPCGAGPGSNGAFI